MTDNFYIHPTRSLWGKSLNFFCNNKTIRATRRFFFSRLPFLKMRSEIKDVVYVNWLVDHHKACRFLPPNISPINFQGKTLFTILTYKHGNFRPSLLSFAKFAFPSPLQSNWRFYIDKIDGESVEQKVWFVSNVMDNLLYALGTRWFSDAMLTHFPPSFRFLKSENSFDIEIGAGAGSCPHLKIDASVGEKFEMPESLSEFFGSAEKALRFICFQDFAVTRHNDFAGYCQTRIDLPIDISQIVPLEINECYSQTLSNLIGNITPFAFLVRDINFEVLDEKIIRKL